MYTSIKGIYENGVLTFSEPAPNIEKSFDDIPLLLDHKDWASPTHLTD